MKLNNYFFLEATEGVQRVVLDPQGACAAGVVTGRPGFPDGSLVVTSRVTKHTPTCVVTKSGSTYELGDPHPDLVELKKAIEEGIPVLTEWQLAGQKHLIGSDFLTGESISGDVTAQDGNYVTLRSNGQETKHFVIWRNLEFSTEAEIILLEGVSGLSYRNFGEQFSLKCVPTL